MLKFIIFPFLTSASFSYSGVTKKRSLSIEPDDEKNEEVHPQKLKTEAGSKPISFDLMKKKSNIKPISINLKAQVSFLYCNV